MQPGMLYFLNNHQIYHGRGNWSVTKGEESGAWGNEGRLLFRTWISPYNSRPLPDTDEYRTKWGCHRGRQDARRLGPGRQDGRLAEAEDPGGPRVLLALLGPRAEALHGGPLRRRRRVLRRAPRRSPPPLCRGNSKCCRRAPGDPRQQGKGRRLAGSEATQRVRASQHGHASGNTVKASAPTRSADGTSRRTAKAGSVAKQLVRRTVDELGTCSSGRWACMGNVGRIGTRELRVRVACLNRAATPI